MGREILFKAKTEDGGKWLEGSVHHAKNFTEIFESVGDGRYANRINVDPETVCQFTGLTDKHGKKIFEGDEYMTPEGRMAYVWFHHGGFCGGKSIDNCSLLFWDVEDGASEVSEDDWYEQIEIIGNIHD